MKKIGSNWLPCHHHRVVPSDTTDPQPRVCSSCRRRFVVILIPSEGGTAATGIDVYRITFREVAR